MVGSCKLNVLFLTFFVSFRLLRRLLVFWVDSKSVSKVSSKSAISYQRPRGWHCPSASCLHLAAEGAGLCNGGAKPCGQLQQNLHIRNHRRRRRPHPLLYRRYSRVEYCIKRKEKKKSAHLNPKPAHHTTPSHLSRASSNSRPKSPTSTPLHTPRGQP